MKEELLTMLTRQGGEHGVFLVSLFFFYIAKVGFIVVFIDITIRGTRHKKASIYTAKMIAINISEIQKKIGNIY